MNDRDESIIEARKRGQSLRAIAMEHGVSATTVQRICRDAEADSTATLAEPLRVYLGWDDALVEPCEVARYSLLANAGGKVDAHLLDDDICGGFVRRGVTKFSYRRFLVPHLCDYRGRALFADGADTLILGDVTELANLDMGGKAILRVRHEPPRGQDRARADTAVMLMDCTRCVAWTPKVAAESPDDRLMRLRDFADDDLGDLPAEWNVPCRPGEEPPPGTKLAHWGCIAPLCPVGAGDWIDFSRSTTWAGWRAQMRSAD